MMNHQIKKVIDITCWEKKKVWNIRSGQDCHIIFSSLKNTLLTCKPKIRQEIINYKLKSIVHTLESKRSIFYPAPMHSLCLWKLMVSNTKWVSIQVQATSSLRVKKQPVSPNVDTIAVKCALTHMTITK